MAGRISPRLEQAGGNGGGNFMGKAITGQPRGHLKAQIHRANLLRVGAGASLLGQNLGDVLSQLSGFISGDTR